MTTFDGSTISLSLSPMMTPVKGDYLFDTCHNLSTLFLTSFLDAASVDRRNSQREGSPGRTGGGSEHGGIKAESEQRGNGGDLHHNQGDGGAADPREPDQEKEKEVPHTILPEKEQEKEGREGKDGSLRPFTISTVGFHLS